MKKDVLVLNNLALIITEKCNLKCAHCMRGDCTNKNMEFNIIRSTLDQIYKVQNLCICGGEPLLSIETIEKIFTYIVDNNIIVDQFCLVTNGTLWDNELIRLFDYLNEYIKYNDKTHRKVNGFIDISFDKYHMSEINKLKLTKKFYENVKKFQETKYFYEFKCLNNKLFRQGRANNLNKNDTNVLKPTKIVVSKSSNKYINFYNVGPLVSIATNGTITECDASFKEQQTMYNYGNVCNDSILDVCLNKTNSIKIKKFDRLITDIKK